MPFKPVYLTSPKGVDVLVGSATERENLLGRGYKLKPTEPAKPAKEDAPAPKPAAVDVTKTK